MDFTAQSGTQTSPWPPKFGRREGGGSGRGDGKQRMKQAPSEGIKDNHCLSWAGKVGYWNIGEPREGALGIFLITQAQERATSTEQGPISNPMQSTPSLEGY